MIGKNSSRSRSRVSGNAMGTKAAGIESGFKCWKQTL